MITYLFDTGVLSAYLLARPKIVTLVDPWVKQSEVATSMLVYGEIIEYLKSKPDYRQLRKDFRSLIRDDFVLYPLTYAIMERYAELRRAMRPPRGAGLIGDIDTVIAATALQHQATLITADSDFLRVPGLLIQHIDREWLKA